ncbi:MAG: hypothetical protein D6698_10700 [Gammaproteobacteria bacterium]|nr:MAG: hypothetical protein D6698_10700 [Gammaproteobacteria bacterium]
MKKVSFLALVFSFLVGSAQAGTSQHEAVVKESRNAGIYTYFLVDENGKEYWIAGPKTNVPNGKTIQFTEEMWMENFTSKTLHETFDKVMFVSGINWEGMTKQAIDPSQIRAFHQNEAKGDAGSLTVAEVFEKRKALAGKIVSVKGEVTKVTDNIMGRSWIHIKDGTGEGDKSDLVFRSKSQTAELGEKITAKGIVAVDQDFGFGYYYPVIVEDATFEK